MVNLLIFTFMIKLFQKLLLLVAVFTVTAHSIFPHVHLDDIMAIVENHHHDEQSVGTHHRHDADNNKDNHQNLFSFAQLDDDFIPANGQPKNLELKAEYLPVLIAAFLSDIYAVNTKPHFGWYIEYPPPDDYLYNLPSRAPPAVI